MPRLGRSRSYASGAEATRSAAAANTRHHRVASADRRQPASRRVAALGQAIGLPHKGGHVLERLDIPGRVTRVCVRTSALRLRPPVQMYGDVEVVAGLVGCPASFLHTTRPDGPRTPGPTPTRATALRRSTQAERHHARIITCSTSPGRVWFAQAVMAAPSASAPQGCRQSRTRQRPGTASAVPGR